MVSKYLHEAKRKRKIPQKRKKKSPKKERKKEEKIIKIKFAKLFFF